MNPRSIRTLEYPKILDQLAGHTSFSAGRELALALRPSADFDEVARRQGETTQAKELLARQGNVSLSGAHDVRPQVRMAQVGGMLQPQDLLDIRDTLAGARNLRQIILRLREHVPLLATTAERLAELPDLIGAVDRCINDRGEVLDSASPRLAQIRRDLIIAHERIISKLQRLVTSPDARGYLQEPIITQREGRYVVPLRSEFKGRIPGLIHDTSASGATLFIEPLAVVELGNQYRELQLEEGREIERILRQLSAQVATHVEAINQTVEALAELDLVLAKAKYSYAIRGIEPMLLRGAEGSEGAKGTRGTRRNSFSSSGSHEFPRVPPSSLKFLRARHPLLPPDTVVPIDISVGQDFRVLVITGPNTGGKTVALKTTGLLTLMAQAGLHIPAMEGSQLTVFGGVYADIGDEQSIEQSLSTFSSHMTNIIEILRVADSRSLVLLDEIGAGTDPTEGSALARAILSYLLERDVTTIATTHYNELKVFAHTTPGVQNASVEFDVETLSPTFELTIGLPGRSNALAIAQRLGLSGEVLEKAKQWLSASDLAMEDLLAEIKVAQEDAVAARESAEASRRAVQELERELRARLAAVEEERRRIINEARREAQAELEAFRQELRRLRRQLAQVAEARELVAEATAAADALQAQVQLEPPSTRLLAEGPETFAVGDLVWVTTLQAQGEIIALDDGQAEVQLGSLRALVPLSELELRQAAQPVQEPGVRLQVARPPDLRVELNLRGLRTEEAIARVEKYLDDAYLAGLPRVRIIHGKGTGALRQAVRQLLDRHPLVISYRPGDRFEGEDGVTVAELANRVSPE